MTMPQPPAEPDEEIFAALARAVERFDPPPSELTAANRELLSWRDPDAALAELVGDSRELAGAVRGPTDELVLRFAAADVVLTVQVESMPRGGYHLVGQVEAEGLGTVTLRRPSAVRSVTCDEWGRFQLDDVEPGPVSFRWTPPDPGGRPVETAWTLL
jgi:hypothetical protein